jgi:hypothetical protein
MKQETSEDNTNEEIIQKEAQDFYNLSKDYRRERNMQSIGEVKF